MCITTVKRAVQLDLCVCVCSLDSVISEPEAQTGWYVSMYTGMHVDVKARVYACCHKVNAPKIVDSHGKDNGK